jgi:hypothetical protein
VWQRFERLRNKLPLVDHQLIAQAEPAIWRGNTARPP